MYHIVNIHVHVPQHVHVQCTVCSIVLPKYHIPYIGDTCDTTCTVVDYITITSLCTTCSNSVDYYHQLD